MWLLNGAANSGGDTVYTLLSTLAVVLLGAGGLLRRRQRRRHPEIDPEPVVRRVVPTVESFLQKRVKELQGECAALQRDKHDQQVRIEKLIEALSTCRAERSDLMYRLREDRDE